MKIQDQTPAHCDYTTLTRHYHKGARIPPRSSINQISATHPILSLLSAQASTSTNLLPATRMLMKLENLQPRLNENSLFLFFKGNLLYQLKYPKEAIACYKYSLHLSPDNILTHHKLAEIYYKFLDLTQAKHHLDLALALSKTQETPLETKKNLQDLQEDICALSLINPNAFERSTELNL